MSIRILVVDDEPNQLDILSGFLDEVGFDTVTASSGEAALNLLDETGIDAIVSDMKMGGMSGLSLLQEVRKRTATLPFILVTAYSSVDDAVAVMKEGATDYITKPVNLKELQGKLDRALEHKLVVEENQALRSELVEQRLSETFLTLDPVMQEVLSVAARAARADVPVLILGESGTGKELLARTIHGLSSRRENPFVPVNCASLNPGVLESELFGHEKGSFTGASGSRTGRFEMATGGTLFLDEIGDIPMETQVKLLRVLQEREIERVGGNTRIPVNFRLVCATNRNLDAMMMENRFRDDLFYRINVITLTIPPLRKRRQDIPLLLEHFLNDASKSLNIPSRGFSRRSFQALTAYDYPGNVRELKNIVQRALVLSRGDVIDTVEIRNGGSAGPDTTVPETDSRMGSAVEAVEIQMIQEALMASDHVKVRAAEKLGISERNLRYKMKKYGIRDRKQRGTT